MTGIDVAIPNYNYGRFLASCVASILRQGEGVSRILIIDNASTDGSQEIMRALARTDPRIELRLREQNLGPHASFNEAVDWARSDHFTILCADDLLPAGALGRAMAIMDDDPATVMVFGRTAFVPAGHSLHDLPDTPLEEAPYRLFTGTEFLERVCRTGRSPVGGPTTVVRTIAQKRAGHYSASLAHTDDAEMWMRLACLGSIAEVDAVLSIARLHSNNQSAVLSNVHLWNVEMERTFEFFFNGKGAALPEAHRLHVAARRSLAARAYWCALSHLVRHEPGAGALFAHALRLRPALALVPPVASLFDRDDAGRKVRRTLMSVLGLRPASPPA